MKAVILAAGQGKRLSPVSAHMPKHVIPFCGYPFIHYLISELQDLVEEMIVVVGYKKEQIKKALRDVAPDVPIRFIEQNELLGTGHALLCAQPYIDDLFLTILGDVCINRKSLIDLCSASSPVSTIIDVEDPENHLQVEHINGSITRFYGASRSVDAGAWVLPASIFPVLQSMHPDGELRIVPAVSLLYESGLKFSAYELPAPWLQFGDHSGIQGLRVVMEFFLSKNGYDYYAPLSADCLISNSDVELEARDCTISNSIVFGKGSIRDCTILNSLICCDHDVQGKCASDLFAVW